MGELDGANMKILRFTLLGGLVTLLSAACASSTVTAFKDPAYQNASYGKLAVFSLGMNLDAGSKLESEICAKVDPLPCIPGKQILPPTRNYNAEELLQAIRSAGVDSALVVNLTSDQSATNFLGSISNTDGSANTVASTSYFGTTTANTYYSGTTTTTPVYQQVRAAFGEVTLLDVEDLGIAWKGEIKTSGSGRFSVTDSAFILSASSEIANQLKATGFFNLPGAE